MLTSCMECGLSFEQKRHDHVFCHKDHKHAYHNRQIKRGNRMFPLVYRWRALRSSDPTASNAAFSRLCSLLSDWIDDDRSAGRAVPAEPWLGVPNTAAFKPTTNQAAMSRADRRMNRDHARFLKHNKL